MDKVAIKELNSLLKGEHMAIDSYEKVLPHVKDENMKQEIQRLQQQHKNHAIRLADRVQDLGGTPTNGVGIIGKTTEVISNFKDIGKSDAAAYLREIYEGENKGIQSATNMVKGKLDDDSMKLVNSILNEERTDLDALKNMINASQTIQ